MKNKTLIFILFSAIKFSTFAQSPLNGYSDFNDAGVYAVIMNPARGSGTPEKLSLNLAGMGILFSSNVAKTKLAYSLLEILIGKPVRNGKSEFSSPYFQLNDKHLKRPSINVTSEVLLPSIKINIHPKFCVFVLLKERVMGNLSNLSPGAIQLINDNSFNIQNGLSATFRLKAIAFHQMGLGFSATVIQKHQNLLKIGFTQNINRRMGLYQIALDQFELNFNKDNLAFHSEYKESIMNENYYSGKEKALSYLGKNAMGFGQNTDFGLVYEYRPYALRNTYTTYNNKGKNNNFRSTRNIRYLYRLSASIKDLGSIKFGKGVRNKSYSLHTTLPFDSIKNNLDAGYIYGFIDRNSTRDSSIGVTVKLPAIAQISFDYHINPHWFFNINYTQNLRSQKKLEHFTQPSIFQFSIRKESDRVSYAIPVYIIPSQRIFNFGFTLKVGPLFISTYNIRSLFSKKMYSFSIAAGLLFTIRYNHDPTIESNNW